MDRSPCVYILASRFRGTLYIGVTSDLIARIWQHRQPNRSSFTGRYAVYRLVHCEHFGDMDSAITREKRLKRWHRQWKINLIEENNPHWDDLAIGLGFERLPERAGRAARTPASRAGGEMDPETSSG